jgi:hypothetical protein
MMFPSSISLVDPASTEVLAKIDTSKRRSDHGPGRGRIGDDVSSLATHMLRAKEGAGGQEPDFVILLRQRADT